MRSGTIARDIFHHFHNCFFPWPVCYLYEDLLRVCIVIASLGNSLPRLGIRVPGGLQVQA